jgi:hypothetical protein
MYEAITRHFGIDKHWPEPGAMPAPRSGRIQLPAGGEPQELIRATVAQCYSITEDDARFSSLAALPGDQRRAEFRRQRSTYPIRREFHATQISGVAGRSRIGETLAALGFCMEESQEASW